jgi:hypothetical protein
MNVGADEPPAVRDVIEGRQVVADERDDAPSPFQAPFEGWLAFADVISDADPDLAGLMVGGAFVARAALEEQIPSMLDALRAIDGMPPGVIDGLAAALRVDNVPLSPDLLAEQLAFNYEGVTTDSTAGQDVNPLEKVDAAIHAFLDEKGDIAREMYDTALQQVKEVQAPSVPHWKAVCSLELPSALNTLRPIRCVRRGHPIGRARLVALEVPYTPEPRSRYTGPVDGPGQVGKDGVGKYEPSIDETFPPGYWDSIVPDSNCWGFAVHLIEGPRSQFIANIARLLGSRRSRIGAEIDAQINQHVEWAQQRLEGVLLAANLSLAVVHPLVALLAKAAAPIAKFIVNKVIDLFGHTTLTEWTIWHTAIMGSDQVPISTFTLAGAEATPGLQRLVEVDGVVDADVRYQDQLRPIVLSQTRFMIGASQVPQDQFKEDYFALVARTGRPLAWQEPLETNSGLRILVPHLDRQLVLRRNIDDSGEDRYEKLAKKSKAFYISAIRADVRLVAYTPPAVTRKPTGKSGSFAF